MSKQNSFIAKITRPSASRILIRKRLFKLLDRSSPVTWLSAPAGSGKTTLISSYLDARKLPCLWYQVDEGDTDIPTFFYYMGLAAKKAAPRYRKSLPLLTPEYLMGIPTFTKRYFEELFRRLPLTLSLSRKGRGELKGSLSLKAARLAAEGRGDKRGSPPLKGGKKGKDGGSSIPPPLRGGDKGEGEGGFVIVLDNYQDVPADSKFHEMLIHGLDIIPEGINIIVLSRAEPPPHFARLKANNKMSFVGWDDIRFTLMEAKGIIKKQTNLKLKKNDLMQLYSETDGWAAGLILMTESLKESKGLCRSESARGGKVPDFLIPGHSDTKKVVFDYFAEEIFRKLDSEPQDFLLITSLLPETIPLNIAENLTGNIKAGRILSTLNSNHFFTERQSGKEPVYRYHPLFKKFLQSMAERTFSIAELSHIRLRAAELLEESGWIEDAARLFIESGEWSGLSAIALKNADTLISQGRSDALKDWLLCIPEEISENNPWLLFWLAVCKQPLNPSESLKLFERSFKMFRSSGDKTGTLLSWASAVACFFHEWNDFTPLDYWIEQLDDQMKGNISFPSPGIKLRVISSIIAALMIRQPWRPDIHQLIEQAMSLARHEPDTNLKMQTYLYAVNYYVSMGDFMRVRVAHDELCRLPCSPEVSPLIKIAWLSMDAALLVLPGGYPYKALAKISEGLEIARATGVHIWDHMFFSVGTYAAIVQGDLPAASEFLRQSKGILRYDRRTGLSQNYYNSGWYNFLNGDVSLASAEMKAAHESAVETGYIFHIIQTGIGTALVLHEQGLHIEAGAYITRAYDLSVRTKSLICLYNCLMAKSWFAIKEGREKEAIEYLRKAFRTARENRYTYLIWWWDPRMMSRLCETALENGIEVPYVRELIRKCGILPESPIAAENLDNWPFPLRIYTQGKFEIIKDEKPLVFTGKVQKKPLKLLKAIIAFGGKDVPVVSIIDAIWPEAEGDKANSAFTTTLQRLRKLLGRDDAIMVQDRKATLNPLICRVDSPSKK